MEINETEENIMLTGRLGQAKIHSSKTRIFVPANYLRFSVLPLRAEAFVHKIRTRLGSEER